MSTQNKKGGGNAVWWHVATPIAASLIINGVIYLLGWSRRPPISNLLPPGPIIGAIWVVLLGLLGYAHYVVGAFTAAGVTIAIAIVYCLAYPFLTAGLRQDAAPPLNTGAMIMAAACCIMVALSSSTRALAATLPLLAWAAYVNFTDDVALMTCRR
jgi:translocator protein